MKVRLIFLHVEFLALFYRRSENVSVLPIVISDLELGNIERKIFAAYLVERAGDASLDNGPKAFDSLSMHRADKILLFGMVDNGMWVFSIKALVPNPLIAPLRELQSLTNLDLSYTQVEDLAPLKELKSLTSLDLRGTKVATPRAAAGIAH
jgi:Leucine-rich repeat (LRR) protein